LQSITSSSDGSKLAAVGFDSYIYTSSDSGDTWIESLQAGSLQWRSITSSSDGSKLAAVASLDYISIYKVVSNPLCSILSSTNILKMNLIGWSCDQNNQALSSYCTWQGIECTLIAGRKNISIDLSNLMISGEFNIPTYFLI
jgi:hypothetical protein